jgi:uncharacterized cupredoxin-like copper-binding protein
MGPIRATFAPLKGTLLLCGTVLGASAVVVVILAAMPAKAVAGDVPVVVTNFRITMPTVLKPGRHTFALSNGGSVPHELLVFRTDLPGKSLPVGPDGDVIEDSPLLVKLVDSGSATNPGASVSAPGSQPFTPGHYVAVCNLPGHYRLGMWLNVTVR